ncbi:SAF domain-containing protein [Enterocloster bolteae]|uniref:Flp pilus assembly protein CpaB n=1 Tax=Clostridia TaxID=186801 RepID=UPI000CCDC09C|nr:MULTISPECIES: RcpC/CpaB family pilus assembly protein [Clostridia]MBS6219505.1 pilus assembly protein CpaB [[Clostridium] symbiosum]MCB6928314.1 SAF domain-containing protein [Enterocloster bolteae]PNV63089.1 pilus assembly protein CpaB [Clostridium sp. chh4-2]
MSVIKNRTVIGILCIVLSLVICFAVTPLFNKSISKKTEIVRVVKPIKIGDEITKDMVKRVEVGAYNLPKDVVRTVEEVTGRYASAAMVPGDYIIHSKIADEPAAENAYLYSLTGEKQAVSLSIRAFANGLSGKLISGDIVSVIAPDYRKQGATVIPPELQYVEVIAVTANSGYDANTTEKGDKEEEKELPGTVTLLATPEQSKILAELEADGKPHLALVYRGSKENAAQFVEAQDARLLELYPPEEEEKTEETETESQQMPEETQEAAGETEPGLPVTPLLEQEEG